MKKTILLGLAFCLPAFGQHASAQIPVLSLFTGVVKKVIIAIDLKVQQLQNRTIALQNAEQILENNLHLNSLNDISGWLNKEKNLYADYYRELATVRKVIGHYNAVKEVISRQKELVAEYQSANALFRRDGHFSPAELNYMGTIYNGILAESLRDLETVTTAIADLRTRMDDAERWQRINEAANSMHTNLDHLRQFNRQNVQLSLSRARDAADRKSVRQLYDIN